ncbi:MAG: hypothetical protein B6242_02475 [Anaerolineaceae bacterium 4572_78]|nr:MAG: hypothetical protein B6242_02475 [Anaerolineaceae bacterium 4572_78]
MIRYKSLMKILSKKGYKVLVARNGILALQSVLSSRPDLILLDIMMPNMSGYEVCEHLKSNKQTHDIPIIFMSASDELFNKVKAFSVGGVDYITKPFQTEEVLARVKTHLTIHYLQRDLEKRNAELDAFAHTVAHDLKNPISAMITSISMLIDYCSDVDDTDIKELLFILLEGGKNAARIIDEILLLAGTGRGNVILEPLDMANIISKVKKLIKPMIDEYHGIIVHPSTWATALGHAPWIEQVWINYISNALKYGGHPPHIQLGFTAQVDGTISFWVRDNGSGLSHESQATLFKEFTRLDKVKAEGYGLGLSIARRIVEKLGGEVGVKSEIGKSSVFYFTLPQTSTLLTPPLQGEGSKIPLSYG